jgi:hypothetical protein
MLVAGRQYQIQFDENDNNGNPCGRVHQCIVGDMYLETTDMGSTRFNTVTYTGKIGFEVENKIFAAVGFSPWSGNMIWNSYKLTEENALMLINHLIKSGKWTVNEAPTEQYEKFAGGQAFDKNDLQACY